MPLFEEGLKPIGKRPMFRNESKYDYYSRSERPGISALRDHLEDWFTATPGDGQSDLAQRFRDASGGNHDGAFFEIYLHRLLSGTGFELQGHPRVENKKTRPDFLALKDGKPRFYLEATVARESDKTAAEQRRLDEVYEALERIKSPNFYIYIQVRGVLVTPPSGANLRADLERWLSSLNYKEVAANWQASNSDGIVRFIWAHDGCELTFEPIPKPQERIGSNDIRTIGATMPEAKCLSLHEDVKNAINRKNKYGELDLPFIVAINVTSEFRTEKFDVMNALFGEETVEFGGRGIRPKPGPRLRNGAWFGPHGPQNTKVSTVMVYSHLSPWNARISEPYIVLNPWARVPLPPNELPFTQFVPEYGMNKVIEQTGKAVGEFLGLPDPWPVPDE